MNGLYLQGGGAKGAFQAGVIYGLYERGLEFNILAGTSIGAINGYYMRTNNFEKLKETWLNIDKDELEKQRLEDRVIENEIFIRKLENLSGKNEDIKDFYVNYVSIENNSPIQVVKNIVEVSKKEALQTIKYSSLLPYMGPVDITVREAVKGFDSTNVFEQFELEVINGKYNGYNLDGGILNNNFLEAFIEKEVDKLYIVQFKKNYEIPDYILEKYDRKNLVIIGPDEEFDPQDTLRFEREFCKRKFFEGYDKARGLNLK